MWHRPVFDIICAFARLRVITGVSIRLTPPASAMSHSPWRMLRQAWCTDTSDDEHAVSSATLGPRRSKKYEMRLAAMLPVVPVGAKGPGRPKISSTSNCR